MRFENSAGLALGIDAGGTQTRWALADRSGAIVADGAVAGFSALQMQSADGRAAITAALGALAAAARAVGALASVHAGVTGFGGGGGSGAAGDAGDTGGAQDSADLPTLMKQIFGGAALCICSDIELACRAAFEPGGGYLVYAGTGSIAAYVDAGGAMHRAGGRGGLLDDGGSGFWIAREALRRIWRREDAAPGAWQCSVLARTVFEHIGGSDWALTRHWLYGASRGEVGGAAVAVAAAAAAGDTEAQSILTEAGHELARLALALLQRHGPRPVALAGRVFDLDAGIEAALRAALPAALRADTALRRVTLATHVTAAHLAHVALLALLALRQEQA